MRVLALLVAALIGTFLVATVEPAAPAGSAGAAGQHFLIEASTTAHTHPDLVFADEATPSAPAVALLRSSVRTVVRVPVTSTATRVDNRVARGPPDGR
ncbi:hypothetical protein ACQPZF_15805 [Actinosynnema sp. CS-041913]|uniref:hypothetical protein n=1 Tax=Actinosynnema sp. CS-041913 TaxID=3239917 RepID=UPI003D919A20